MPSSLHRRVKTIHSAALHFKYAGTPYVYTGTYLDLDLYGNKLYFLKI